MAVGEAAAASAATVRTTTLSNVAVASRVVSWLDTPRPRWTSAGIANVSLPTVVHVDPFAERNAVIVLPRRSSFTHIGAVPAPPLVLVDIPPCATRRWNASPLPGETSMNACAESAVSRSRIMTPALTQACTCILPMRRGRSRRRRPPRRCQA